MSIHMHIERLILDGLDIRPDDRHRLQAAVEAELSRLLTERGMGSDWHHDRDWARLAAPAIELASPPDASALGARVGGSLHGAIVAGDQKGYGHG